MDEEGQVLGRPALIEQCVSFLAFVQNYPLASDGWW